MKEEKIMKTNQKQNMITGNPTSTLVLFALPMIIGNLFQQIYNIVDSVVVGRYIGSEALAAVGASSSITFLFVAIATGISIGSSVVISQLFGARQMTEMKTSIYTAIISILGIALISTIVGLVAHRLILQWMNTPVEVFEDAATYLKIYFMGLLFLFLYNISNSVFNALGESKIPLLFLMLSSVINIVLDLAFVISLKMGVAGVAWATLISQVIAGILCFVVLMHRLRKVQTENRASLFDLTALKRMCRIALPSTIQQSIVSVGIVCVQSLVNTFGPAVMAGYTAATKIDNIAINPMVNIGNAVSTFTAQNIGAGKPERVKKGYRAGVLMNLVICSMLIVLLLLAGEQAIGAFLDTAAPKEALEFGISYLRLVGMFYFVMGFMNVTNGVLRGAGDITVFMVSTLANFFSRVTFAYILAGFIGSEAIMWSIPIGWFIGLSIAYVRYRTGKWKTKSLVKKGENRDD